MEIASSGIQLEDINALRKYPLSENSTLLDDRGVPIDNRIIVSLCIVSYVDIDAPRISYVYVGNGIVSIAISDNNGLVATFLGHDCEPSVEYTMTPERKGVVCKVVFGDAVSDGSVARHRFSSSEQSGIHEFCIVRVPGSIVTSVTDAMSGESFTGDISFAFSGGVYAENTTDGVVLSASDSLEKVLSTGCVPTDLNKSCIAPVIQTINGVKPNEFGEIALVLE